jgi:hypothetical protein
MEISLSYSVFAELSNPFRTDACYTGVLVAILNYRLIFEGLVSREHVCCL